MNFLKVLNLFFFFEIIERNLYYTIGEVKQNKNTLNFKIDLTHFQTKQKSQFKQVYKIDCPLTVSFIR